MWDLSAPGHKYLGPGNALDKGTPNNWNDYVAMLHDYGYNVHIEEGRNPYIIWSEDDAIAYRNFEGLTSREGTLSGQIAKEYFSFKKFLSQIGVLGTSLLNFPDGTHI